MIPEKLRGPPDDTCLYTTTHKEGDVLIKLQSCLTLVESRCERWKIKINEDKSQTIYSSHRHRQVGNCLKWNGEDISFVNFIEYLGVNFDRKITRRLHKEVITTETFRIFFCDFPFFFQNERLSISIKLSLQKALIRSILTYTCPLEVRGRHVS
jgi:hypothetical protein